MYIICGEKEDEKETEIHNTLVFVSLHGDADSFRFPSSSPFGAFCLHADLATCAGEDCNTAGMHHEGDGDRHTCTVGCVTHFQCATTGHHQDTVAPDYTFYSFLYTFAYLLHLVYMPEAALLSDGMYIENLHTQDVACNTGLRAPPVC